jgi:hypothetical protein
VEHHVRELFESAIAFSEKAMHTFGFSPEKSEQFLEAFRQRDADRLQTQLLSGIPATGNLPIKGESEAKPA